MRQRIGWYGVLSLWIILLGCFPPALPAQPEELSRETWEEAVEGLDYGEVKQQEDKPPKDSNPQRDTISGNAAGAVRLLLIALAVIAIAILIAILLGVGKAKNKKLKDQEITIDTLEENLPESDVDPFLRQALANEDYRLAVRLLYLGTLQQLANNRLIEWKRNKTNREYLIETRYRPWSEEWRSLTHIFERIRYGGQTIDKNTFESLHQRFEAFRHTISQPQMMDS
jgi:hypothetical protein